MTSTICSNATEGDSKQLIDERDGKKYWVTKLKDNNCWMTQNMDSNVGRMDTSSLSGYKSEYGGYYVWEDALVVCGDLGGSWTLPTRQQFIDLTSGITQGSVLIAPPYNFQYGGLVDNGSLNGAGSVGSYWSSTSSSSTQASYLSFGSSDVRPSNNYYRYGGLSVRCVAR